MKKTQDQSEHVDEQKGGRSDILNDKRRLNVAITRAKCKLVLVGNVPALKSYEPFEKLLSYLQKHNKILQIHQEDLKALPVVQ